MRSLLKFKLICVLLISFGNINAQDSFILNYEDVEPRQENDPLTKKFNHSPTKKGGVRIK